MLDFSNNFHVLALTALAVAALLAGLSGFGDGNGLDGDGDGGDGGGD